MNTLIREAGEGEKLWFYGGGVHTWKVTAAETAGSVAVLEDVLEQGKTTPLHTHPDSDEVVYVLEGELLIHADGNPRVVGPGSVIVNPRGVPHAFLVKSERARILSIITPGARTESFYRSASTPGESGPVDFGKVGQAAKETGATVILGPPPFSKP
jgi:quercetin dioxygenase-like cupin family protein